MIWELAGGTEKDLLHIYITSLPVQGTGNIAEEMAESL